MNVVFRRLRENRYSLAALVGAVEISKELKDLKIFIEDSFPENKIKALLRSGEKVIVVYSFMTASLPLVRQEIQKLRNLFGNKILIVAGGPHASGAPESTLEIGFDCVFIGEGEKSFPEFLRAVKTGKDWKSISGIAYIENNKFIKNDLTEFINLDDYPPFAVEHGLFAPIEITRGCAYRCKFCQTPRIFCGVRHRSVSSVVRWVKFSLKRGYKDMRFITPNVLSYGSLVKPKKEKLEKLLKTINKTGARIFLGSFPSEVRPEQFSLELAELLKKYVSNKNIIIGVQSGSDRILQAISRGHSVNDCFVAVENALQVGFTPICDFIFCLPSETEEDVELTKKAIRELIRKNVKIRAHVFMPLPETPYENEKPSAMKEDFRKFLIKLEKSGRLEGDWKKQEKLAIN